MAQTGNPGNLDPVTPILADGTPGPDYTNSHDILAVQLLMEGGMAEIAFAELAAERSHRPEIRDFSTTVIDDHGKANGQLQTLAEASGIPLPEGLNAEHQAMHDRLAALSGDDFDRAYIESQITDRQKTPQLLSGEADTTRPVPAPSHEPRNRARMKRVQARGIPAFCRLESHCPDRLAA